MLLLRQPEVSYREVADVLMLDAGFAAEVLRLANSAAAGCRFPTASILQALTVLGIPRVSALTAALALSRFLKPVSKLPALRACWRHNLACAIASSRLADRYNLDPDFAYTFGLLHDIGRMGMLVAFPRDYPLVVQRSAETQRCLTELEFAAFGFDHREVGGWLAEQWRLPTEVAEVSMHHGPGGNPPSPLTKLVNEACILANRIGFTLCASVGGPYCPLPKPPMPESEFDLSIAEQVNLCEQEFGL
jgi:putative nucleotidyltransferase with HDIG domain